MFAAQGAAFKAAIVLVIASACGYLSLFLVVKSAWFQHWLKAEIAQRSGYEISFADLSLVPPVRLVASAIAASRSDKIVLESDRLALTLSPSDFFFKTVHRLRLYRPVLHINLEELFASSERSGKLPIRHLNIEEGVIVLQAGEMDNLELRSVNLNARNLNFEQPDGLALQADVPWLKARAEISVRSHNEEVQAGIRLLQEEKSRLPAFLAAKDPSLPSLEVDLTFRRAENQFVQASATGKANGFRIGSQKVSGRLNSAFRVLPGRPEADLFAEVTLTDFPSEFDFLPFPLPRGTATATLQGQYSFARKALDMKSLRLRSLLGNAEGSGQIAFNPQATFSSTQLRINNISVENLRSLLPQPASNWSYTGRADADLELHGLWSSPAIRGVARAAGLQLRGEQFSLADLTVNVPLQWVKSSFSAHDVQLQGKKLVLNGSGRTRVAADEIRFGGELDGKAKQPLKALGTLRITGGRFATADNAKMGENLTASGHFAAAVDRARHTTSAKGTLVVEQGELLWGKFFGDLKAQRSSLEFDGNYNANDDAIRLRRFALTLIDMGTIETNGSIEQVSKKPVLNLAAKSGAIQAGPVFDFFIRETLNRAYPSLNQLMVGGHLGFSFQARGPIDNLAAEGTLELRNAEIRTKSESSQWGPIELTLPFRVQIPGGISELAAANLPTGNLAIQRAHIGTEPIGSIKTSVSLWNNRLQFRKPIIVPIYGGTIELSNLAWKDVIRDPRLVSFSVQIKDLQLQRVTENLGWYRFGGTLAGSIPQAEWAEDSLRSRGEIRINVFGGRVRIGTLEVEQLFSSIPSVKLDASFQNIHLDQASETFAFGRVSGILEGTLNDLVITAGEPSQFRADLHTVDKPGSSQWISVEALNKITVLSSGNEAGALYAGLGGFFENFRYSKMGFKAVLKNDKLTLRGIESEAGKEYLVVGTLLPPTVNIISHTQEIGFSELLRRLERIKETEKPETR
jgi:hypothetical protein